VSTLYQVIRVEDILAEQDTAYSVVTQSYDDILK